ncbi:methylaspartate mutase subunit S [Geobacter argillaceus]|uniref:Glutamate mutase subunit S n=1 Tax=Geobacter argillaceus TaxID=345631 RepID=A0A562WR35_9BACT|nr:methylaspartate mutase subunit S [Geobacter argillaceus]TWJ32615.1 glutamate mutase subunit S [Geobacter argillaceus]
MTAKNIVIGTIGSDAHMIGGWVLTKAFKEAGFGVTFLGAVVPQEEFVNAAIETAADAILVSSMYGMGVLDCEGLRDRCIEAGLKEIILYAGGTVAAPLELERNWPEIERRFSEMGFNRVFRNTVTAGEVVTILKKDLGLL